MANSNRKRINLALQGGGALGAYTWGVLDKMLEDDRIEIEAVSGASAGAMNAVVMSEGFFEGGENGARQSLRRFWEGVAKAGQANALLRNPLEAFMGSWMPPWTNHVLSPFTMWMDLWQRYSSPYDFNPLNLNPVKELLEELVDFSRVQRCQGIKLFIGATNVETGRVRIFTNAELTADHVMASACLPLLFQAVTIDGEAYWDGGFMGNPPLFPLFEGRSRDIVVVQINPIERPGVPRTAKEIVARMNEITFNASLLREMRAIDFVARLLRDHRLEPEQYREMLLHVISDDEALLPLGPNAGLNTDLFFFEKLFEIGRVACTRWLDQHFEHLGHQCTVDLRAMFQGDVGPIATPPPRAARRA